MHPRALLLPLVAAFLAAALPASAQWTTQTISLRPGWNAVFLEVQPEPRECDAVLAGLPVEAVWRWNKRFSAVQFIRDPNEVIAEPAAWLVWIPPGHPLTDRSNPAADRTSLYLMEGGFPYLIKSTNASVIAWNIRGRPVNRKTQWVGDALNLVGFGLPSSSPPSYQSFFGGLAGFTNASQTSPAIYRLIVSGAWVQVTTPATTPMQRGEAFWIRALSLPKFQGPLEIQTDRRTGLDYGRTLTEQTIKISNAATNTRTVVVRPLSSETPLAPTEPAVAGGVPLSYWRNEFGTTNVGWANFPSQIQSNIPPGGVWELRLEVRRRDMAVPPAGSSRYQSLLEIVDAAGLSRQVLPVVADGLQSTSGVDGGAFAPAGTPPAIHPRAGLWIGSASITNVSQPASVSPANPVPTASDFSFRVLVHVDANGQARLLQKVLQMFKAGTYRPAGDGTTNRVMDQPGRYALLTDDLLIPQFTGVAVRDSSQVGRRFTSAAFSFRQPLPMSGTADFASAGARWSCPVVLDYRDPRNPFVHRYHPDHDNKNERFEATPLPEGQESFTIGRQVELQFTATDPDNLSLAGWGDNQIGGLYRETISGLHRSTLYVSGTFRLYQASRVNVLNDGL